MVGLEVELVESGEELGDGADALVSNIDAVSDGEADEAGGEAAPQPLLRDLVTAVDLEAVEALEELHQGLEPPVRHVTTP